MSRRNSIASSVSALLVSLIPAVGVAASCPTDVEYFLRWNTDHTERQVRPTYPVSQAQADTLPVFHVCKDERGRVIRAEFYAYGKPSNASPFGTHRVEIRFRAGQIERVYQDVDGKPAMNRSRVAVERYTQFEQGFPLKKEHIGLDGSLVNDSTGASTYAFERDERGRRIAETRYSTSGELVPEHNGFEQARFEFDRRDYARYRRGYNRHGKPMEGPGGYHTAYFWFNQHGVFTAEEFRDIEDRPALFPPGGYFRVEFREIDELGQWHTLAYFDQAGAPLSQHAAVAVSQFDKLRRRKSVSYVNPQGQAQAKKDGTAQILFNYRSDGTLDSMKRYGLDGRPIE
ncbi:MAG: hypothetical protein AAFU77_14130 [Myxococcota bacterium]